MTITLTKEEVTQFKSELVAWTIKRTEYVHELKVKKNAGVLGDDLGNINIVAEVNKWEKENPAPTLVKI